MVLCDSVHCYSLLRSSIAKVLQQQGQNDAKESETKGKTKEVAREIAEDSDRIGIVSKEELIFALIKQQEYD